MPERKIRGTSRKIMPLNPTSSHSRAGFLSLFLLLLLLCSALSFADEYQFDLSEIEKKPYSIGGFLEFRPVLAGLRRDGAFHRLRFFDRDEGATLEKYNGGLRLEGSYQKNIAALYVRTDSLLRHDYLGWDGDFVLQEGHLSLKPGPGFALYAGKKVMQWGKGYAFNPVSFVSRPKDPDDPTEALEGYYVVTADLIRSFDGPLKTLSFTPVILPVTDTLNDDFGEPDHLNLAAKLYLLLWDTDLDFLFFTGGSRTTRYGIDFSRNIRTNFEVHGELAWLTDFEKKSIDAHGTLFTQTSDVLRTLVGIRYLTANEITFIIEYYHNSGGIGEEDAENFYGFVDRAYDSFLSTGKNNQLMQASRLSRNTLAASKPMSDYVYLRASWKEPFDILYFTPAITSIINVDDQSLSVAPELIYSPKTNLELRLKTTFLAGEENTEYGEKQNRYSVEIRARYFF